MLHDNTPYVLEGVLPLLEELDSRLDADLGDEAARLAISSAITKAAIAGFRQGVAAEHFRVSQGGPPIPKLGRGCEDVDLWAERYGDEGQGDG